MKRFALIICGLLILMAGAACAQSELKALMPPYWIVGRVADTPEAKVGSRAVYFYYDDAGFDAGNYAESVAFNNTFIINAFGIFPVPLVVGQTYKVSTEQIDSYGADGTVKISGLGWDEVKGMALYLGGGKKAPGAPEIKLWFGNRLYQPEVYWVVKQPGQTPIPFIVEPKPEIKVEISIQPPYTLASAIESYSIVQDAGTADRKTLPLSAANVTSKTVTAGKVSAMTLKFTVPDPGLTDGEHTFTVTAHSSGLEGPSTEATQVAKVQVIKGPVRLFGPPITYPSPFSISKDKRVYIQYGLSTDANIEIYIVSVGGERIFHRSYTAGLEGGAAGINKVPIGGWDGRTDQGFLAGNAIYVGTIIARDENRLLGKFKLTIVD